jgi:hypothetical protein
MIQFRQDCSTADIFHSDLLHSSLNVHIFAEGKMRHSLLKVLATAIAGSAFLAACGGGSSSADSGSTASAGNNTGSAGDTQNPSPVALPTTVISSVFDGHIDTNQPITAFLQDDGSYFIVYSDAAAPQNASGAIMGSGTLNGGSFSSSDGLDVALAGSGAQTAASVTLSASYTAKTSLNGTVSYTTGGQIKTFTSNYNNAYESLPSLSALAGVYTGTITTKDQVEANIELTVTADGKLSGTLPCGCSITAQLVPRSDGTAYDATLAFTGGNHPFSGKSFAGNVYLDTTAHRLYIVGKLTDSSDRAIFVGTRTGS